MASWKWYAQLLPALFALLACVTCYVYMFGCESIQYKPKSGGNHTILDNYTPPAIKAGPFYRQDVHLVEIDVTPQSDGSSTGIVMDKAGDLTESNYYTTEKTCVKYPDSRDEIDAPLRVARFFGFLAGVCGGLGAIILVFGSCCFYWCFEGQRRYLWTWLALGFALVFSTCQGLAFFVWRSNVCTAGESPLLQGFTAPYEESCSWDAGSTANVCSIVFFAATGIAMAVQGPPQPYSFFSPHQQEIHTVTYQQTRNPTDGTIVVAETSKVIVKGTPVIPTQPNKV